MDIKNTIRVLRGNESLLLIFSKEVADELNIENQESLAFEVKNKEIVIKKIENWERSFKQTI